MADIAPMTPQADLYARSTDGLTFHKAQASQESGACVEVAHDQDGNAYVRDSKNLTLPVLRFTRAEWRAFVGGVQSDEGTLTGRM